MTGCVHCLLQAAGNAKMTA